MSVEFVEEEEEGTKPAEGEKERERKREKTNPSKLPAVRFPRILVFTSCRDQTRSPGEAFLPNEVETTKRREEGRRWVSSRAQLPWAEDGRSVILSLTLIQLPI